MPFLSRQTDAVLLADRPFRVHARRHRILEHDDARDRQDVVRLERVEQRGQVRAPTPAVPAFFANSAFASCKLSPNSSFMSMTSALISVASAAAISLAIRFRLCAAKRFTYSARTGLAAVVSI